MVAPIGKLGLALASSSIAALALAGTSAAGPGKSPNGPPGPAGNPGKPPTQDAPARARGHSRAPAVTPVRARGRAAKPAVGRRKPAPVRQRNPSPRTPRKGGRTDRPAPKVTICHATASDTNPYVRITVSENALGGHRWHVHDGRADMIPAPAEGCPQAQAAAGAAAGEAAVGGDQAGVADEAAEAVGPAGLGEGAAPAARGEGGVAGVRAVGGVGRGGEAAADREHGQPVTFGNRNLRRLPFTGLELLLMLAAGAGVATLGAGLRRGLRRG